MATSTVAETSRNNIYVPVPVPSRYEAQKSRDWYTFGQFLKNHTPPLSMSSCNGTHVIEFLGHLDHLGKTKVHTPICPFFGHPKPPAPCACPVRQAWGSLDSLIGRLRAAYEEHGGKPDTNPFAARAVQLYLREVREWQEKSRGIVKKREPNPLPLVLQPRPGVSVPALVPRVFKMSAVPVSAPTVIRVGAGTAADTAPMPYPLRNRLPRSGSVNAGKGKGSSDKEIKPTTATTAAAATAAAAPTAAASAAAVTPTAAATSPTTAATTATTDAVTTTTATADVVATTTAIADVVTTTTATADVVTTTIATKRSSSDGQTLQKERRTRVCRGNKK